MFFNDDINLQELIIHKVGNKLHEDNVHLSDKPVQLNHQVEEILCTYFLKAFKTNEYYTFHHEDDLSFNEVYRYVSEVFENPELLYDNSIKLANHLYENSTHPKIKQGEFYVAYFEGCIVDGEVVDAIGIFKSETKETFLKIYPSNNNFLVDHEDGININKLDKGCLIYNTEKENGYVVEVVDKISKTSEAVFWRDDFLDIRQRNDSFFQTENTMKMCKNFVTEKLPEEYQVDKIDQADLLNKSAAFFKKQDEFKIEEYANEVLSQPEIIESFNEYKMDYANTQEIPLPEEFSIASSAVKKNNRIMKSVIKLDKNFHIYVHGNRQLIEKDYDSEKGMHYYKIYYNNET